MPNTTRANTTSWDWVQIGHTSGQRSAEIVAGLRALTFPDPEAVALSSATGRGFAKLLLNLNNDVGNRNATGARHLALTRLAETFLTEHNNPKVIVELACGFSARALNLARKFPKAKVVEIDLPDVIAAKQERLRQLLGTGVPSNMYWLSADLAVTKLVDLIGDQEVDLVISEGVLPYFTGEEITRIAASVRECLRPNGAMTTDVISAEGWKSVEQSSGLSAWLLKRQVGRFKGSMPSSQAAKKLFEDAGYTYVAVSSLKQLSKTYGVVGEVADTSFLVVAHKLVAEIGSRSNS